MVAVRLSRLFPERFCTKLCACQAETYALKVKGEENSMDYRAFFNQASVPADTNTTASEIRKWPKLPGVFYTQQQLFAEY